MTTPESIESVLASALACRHLQALIVSDAFAGLSRVQRHQRVYAALGDRMRAEIHALSMTTLTPAEWEARG